MPNAPTIPKYSGRVTTVDPSQGLLQVALKSGSHPSIDVYVTGVAFRWPRVGDEVMIRQENNTWMLDGFYYLRNNALTTLQDVDPGDLVLDSPTGIVHVIGSTNGSTDFTITANQISPANTILDPVAGANGTVVATAGSIQRVMRFALKGDGTTSNFTCTHSFGHRLLYVQAQVDSAGTPGGPTTVPWTPTSANAIQIQFVSAPTAGTVYYVTVSG